MGQLVDADPRRRELLPVDLNPIRFLANRGANGIDGVVSAAAGAALTDGGRAWLLTGELALLHDIGGLLAATRAGAELTIVCANNGGGNIFDFLPLAEHGAGDTFEEHVITPSGVDLAQVAALAGLEHRTASTPDEVREAAAEPGLVEVRTDRADNVRLHREVYSRVAKELRRTSIVTPPQGVTMDVHRVARSISAAGSP